MNLLVSNEQVVDDDSTNLLEIPSYLTTDYLESVLKHSKNDETIKVLSINFSEAVPAGHNFASLLLKADVTYIQNNDFSSQKIQQLIIKTEVSDPKISEIMKNASIYSREMVMYDRILPKYHQLLESIGDDEKLYSPALSIDAGTNTIVLKDLSKEGFKLVPRHIACDVDHMNLLINKIAKFHACSVVLNAQGESFKEFDKRINFGMHHTQLLNAMTDEIRSWPGYDYYTKKLDRMQKFVVHQVNTLYNEGISSINVLIHGDLHLNNVLFQYDKNGKLVDLALVKLLIMHILEFFFIFRTLSDRLSSHTIPSKSHY